MARTKRATIANPECCPVCWENIDGMVVLCDSRDCEYETHLGCTNVNEANVNEKFICEVCKKINSRRRIVDSSDDDTETTNDLPTIINNETNSSVQTIDNEISISAPIANDITSSSASTGNNETSNSTPNINNETSISNPTINNETSISISTVNNVTIVSNINNTTNYSTPNIIDKASSSTPIINDEAGATSVTTNNQTSIPTLTINNETSTSTSTINNETGTANVTNNNDNRTISSTDNAETGHPIPTEPELVAATISTTSNTAQVIATTDTSTFVTAIDEGNVRGSNIVLDTVNRTTRAEECVVTANELTARNTNSNNIDLCPVCKQECLGQGIMCVKCSRETHFKCAKITETQFRANVEEYFCTVCDDGNENITRWVRRGIGKAKGKDYFKVEQIVNHRSVRKTWKNTTGREFCIKWLGFEDTTWEPEKHLDGCLNLLQRYCIRKNIRLSSIEGRMGASGLHLNFNAANWTTVERVLEIVKRFRNMKPYKTNIEMAPFGSTSNKDRVLILNHINHCYVILHYKRRRLGYIADGLTECFDKSRMKEIQAYTNFELIPVRYEHQTKIDHCGGSGGCIALAFLQAYKRDKVPTILKTAPSIRARIIETLHPEPSETFIKRFDPAKCRKFQCHCSRKIFKTEMALLGHKRIKGCDLNTEKPNAT